MKKIYLLSYVAVLIGASAAYSQTTLLSQNFNGAGTPAGWVKINNSTGGDPSQADWTLQPDGYMYGSIFVDPPRVFHSNDNSQFYLSNSDAQVGDITETILQSPAFSTQGYAFVIIRFYHHYRQYHSAGYVEVSTNGTTWATASTITTADEDSAGAANAFTQKIVNLNAYGNNSTVYIRFRFYAEFGYYWAIDNILVQGSASGPLPVSLFTFSGYKESNHNILKWSTASEQNNRGFQLERSVDGNNYVPLAFIPSQAAAGTSSALLNYSYVDNNVSGEKQFYRLRQVDLNGKEQLSNIVLIKGAIPKVFVVESIFPNPAATTLNVAINSPYHDKVILQVADINGRLLKQADAVMETGSNTVQMDVSSLKSGTYILRVASSKAIEMPTSKFIKQ